MYSISDYGLYLELTEEQVLPESISTDYRELVINPNCPIQIIIEYICSESGVDPEYFAKGLVDLVSDKCKLLHVQNYDPFTNGLDIFTVKETYYLVFINRDAMGNLQKIVPMLNKFSKEYLEFMISQRRSSSLRKLGKKHSSEKSSSHTAKSGSSK